MSKEIILRVPANIALDQIEPAIDSVVIDLDLTVALRGSLKSFPGSTHWHLKRGRERGTLEITWWPKCRKLWINIQAGRTAPWIDEVAPRLKQEIEARLERQAPSA
jgi:hypothetical protein